MEARLFEERAMLTRELADVQFELAAALRTEADEDEVSSQAPVEN